MNQPGVEGLRPADPEQIGSYRLLGRLGEGGMGTVYLALAPTGRPVALKVVKAEFAIEEGFAARFHTEVENARRVASFCTAQVLDNGNDDDGRPYMVTEYIPGTPLSRQIIEHGALEQGTLHGVALGVAAALAAIHVAGLVHRDLKPANVILSMSGPRVIDFGIARALDSTHSFTRSGEVLGSPGWWAPEQVRGLEITPAADVFAWGCMVAYAGNGRHPYGRGDMMTMATRLLTTPPDLGALPAPLNDLVRRATEMDPYQRPSAQDLLIALVGGGIAAPAAPAPARADPAHADRHGHAERVVGAARQRGARLHPDPQRAEPGGGVHRPGHGADAHPRIGSRLGPGGLALRTGLVRPRGDPRVRAPGDHGALGGLGSFGGLAVRTVRRVHDTSGLRVPHGTGLPGLPGLPSLAVRAVGFSGGAGFSDGTGVDPVAESAPVPHAGRAHDLAVAPVHEPLPRPAVRPGGGPRTGP
ncbi:serine/threonine-protein kinase [Streptosporangium vulgare]|uniref:serine/threonine-protein kinase n=1 Tax=Streptosporangium vulgare TaxID=46190 RepID=UPI0031D7E9E4